MPSAKFPSDSNIWDSPTSDLTWYYNYGSNPSPAFANAKNFQFVPMLWGTNDSSSATAFLDSVRQQLNEGANITSVLAFNEPDGSPQTGGSNIPSDLAAQTWIRQIEPLKKKGIRLGAPAVTGAPTGFTWLQSFFAACDGKCSVDFIPVHWYGNFEGLASHIGQIRGTYPNMSIWVTEYANAGASLAESQSFYNSSSQYFDRIEYDYWPPMYYRNESANYPFSYVERYSYFGAFRSDVSNVGPNAALLTQNGALTDIGSWYLGGSATGNVPQTSGVRKVATTASGFTMMLGVFWCFV